MDKIKLLLSRRNNHLLYCTYLLRSLTLCRNCKKLPHKSCPYPYRLHLTCISFSHIYGGNALYYFHWAFHLSKLHHWIAFEVHWLILTVRLGRAEALLLPLCSGQLHLFTDGQGFGGLNFERRWKKMLTFPFVERKCVRKKRVCTFFFLRKKVT